MAKRENRRSDYSAELRGHSVYDNRLKYMDCNLNQMSQSVYFEFQPRDQVYSYALETNLHGNASDGSNGTVSTYAESSVGPLKNNNSPNNYFHSRNTKQVPTTEQRQGEQNRVSATEQYVSGQGLRDSTQSTGTTYDRINETDINVQVDRRINKHGNTKTQSCALGRVLLILITIIVLLGAGVVLVYVFVINRNNAAQSSDCDTLPQVPNGQSRESISDQGYTTATVRCSHGYELHGNETMTCTEGSWSVKPTCERIQCGPFPEVENGKVNGTDTAFESTASITCNPGFLVEESTITCSGDANWSPPTGCYEHPCGIYTPFDDMMVVEELTLSKMTLCLTCKPGLMFVNGSDQCVTCQNGKWTGSPECEIPASDCDTLPQVPNGQSRESISDQGYTTATVRCSHGYELHGNETMTCKEGSWSVKPTCERIQCEPFPEVENGKVNGTDTAFESTASITCTPGFLVEESTITCSGDGNWSPPTGCYEHPCGIYTPFDDMMVVEELTLSKMTLCLTCKPGLMFVNGSDQCVTCQNGKWTGSPECEIPASDCDTLPQVPNGQSRESISDQGYTTATVRCSHGYELHGNETMSCTEGSWSVKPTCERIQCGPFPEVENGKVNGTDTAFESTASITCNPGFLVEESTITCSGDGNWSPPTGCYEHPCGIYTPFDDMMVVEELTLSKMTLCLTCKPGLMFVNGSDQCVTCQNGKWTGSPECEIPGMVYFDPPKPMYHVDDRVSLTCVVQGSQEWQSIMVAKTNFQSSNTEPLIFLNRTRDEMLIQSLGDTDRSSVSHQITSDGVEVDFEIANALCEDGGVYICGNVVGTVDSPDKVKSTNTSVHIIDVTSSVPEVIVPETMHVGIEDKIKCTSEIGQDENGTVLGEIVFQIKYKNTDSFKNLSSVTEDSLSQKSNCRLNETIVSTFIPENDMHEALVRCVVLTTDGIQLTSTVETLKIVSPRVNISALPHVFTFGETAVITGVMDNIYGWDLIEVRRKCSNTEEYIARITADAQGEPILTDNHVRLTEKDVTSSSARVELKFDSVKCGDSCGSAEETAEYSAAVRINNDTWIERETKIKFQRQPDIPYLDIPYDVISGNTARFECMGEIGDPKGYLEIESTFEDTNFTVFLSSKEGKDSNAFGSITSVTDVNEECSNVRTIAFQIHSLTSKFHQKKMRCVSRPSLLLVNGQSAVSDIKAIEVIPENYCSKPDSYTGARRHPFHCSMFVSCHNGHVTGVPAGCQEVECFQDTACYSCEDIGGCSITDIYVDSFSNWIQLGDSVTLICKVKDFQGLTDIIIYKNHNETVTSSFLGGDFEAGVTKVQDESYISGNNGQLTVFIASVQCKDKGAYRCVPNGTGKHSEDETNLAVRDVDGNTVC
ncbi:uncharacterized protein LOC123556107 isoform X2 [Mercenaria mercenaria]|uniref:uncharacterized protein LOC123556107 isoform X2 n=1 Tax=Mercenaria mercenaria TaxID=6596 RepID=UPI00234EE1B2|nr:uncharacterized protein LOC123556107 isoform X2 [Mercenaria mercenaria]